VKLLKRNAEGCVFLVEKREKLLLLEVLKLYPLLPPNYHQVSDSDSPDLTEVQHLLEEALAEQQAANKAQLLELLSDPGRFRETDGGWRFSLNHAQLEWLLQVLNDIRVGSWAQLGSPDDIQRRKLKADEQNALPIWSMDLCAYFQTALIQGFARD
jgi:hypothetical protein